MNEFKIMPASDTDNSAYRIRFEQLSSAFPETAPGTVRIKIKAISIHHDPGDPSGMK